MLAAERLALVDQLDGLTPDQWDTPSLADGWTVRHVVAHLVMPFLHSRVAIAAKFLLARGNVNRMADKVARADSALPTAELVGILRRNADNSVTPPGAGLEAPLTDLVVHMLDVDRPLGLVRARPVETTRVVLDALITRQSLKFFGIDLAGKRLTATDIGWTTGAGQDVSGSWPRFVENRTESGRGGGQTDAMPIAASRLAAFCARCPPTRSRIVAL